MKLHFGVFEIINSQKQFVASWIQTKLSVENSRNVFPSMFSFYVDGPPWSKVVEESQELSFLSQNVISTHLYSILSLEIQWVKNWMKVKKNLQNILKMMTTEKQTILLLNWLESSAHIFTGLWSFSNLDLLPQELDIPILGWEIFRLRFLLQEKEKKMEKK